MKLPTWYRSKGGSDSATPSGGKENINKYGVRGVGEGWDRAVYNGYMYGGGGGVRL